MKDFTRINQNLKTAAGMAGAMAAICFDCDVKGLGAVLAFTAVLCVMASWLIGNKVGFSPADKSRKLD